MAEEFARGAREAGNDVDVISLAGRKVSFCVERHREDHR